LRLIHGIENPVVTESKICFFSIISIEISLLPLSRPGSPVKARSEQSALSSEGSLEIVRISLHECRYIHFCSQSVFIKFPGVKITGSNPRILLSISLIIDYSVDLINGQGNLAMLAKRLLPQKYASSARHYHSLINARHFCQQRKLVSNHH
jgi:hypothetical protein